MIFFNGVIVIVSFFLIGCYGDTGDTRVTIAFVENNLVPNIVTEAPDIFIRVNYSNVEVDLGSELNSLQTLLQPTVCYDANSDELYTFIFFGPDLSIDMTPRYTHFLHWLIVNIPGDDIKSGDTVFTYFPPVPYPGDFHYLFLLYKQNGRFNSDDLDSLSFILKRPGFDVVEFKNKYNLTGPVGGNFMRQAYLSPSLIKSLLSLITPLRYSLSLLNVYI